MNTKRMKTIKRVYIRDSTPLSLHHTDHTIVVIIQYKAQQYKQYIAFTRHTFLQTDVFLVDTNNCISVAAYVQCTLYMHIKCELLCEIAYGCSIILYELYNCKIYRE